MGDYPLLGDEDLNHEFEPTPEDPHECIHCRAIRRLVAEQRLDPA